MDKRNNGRAALKELANVFEDNEVIRDETGRAVLRSTNSGWQNARETSKEMAKLETPVENNGQTKLNIEKLKPAQQAVEEKPFEEKEIRVIAVEDKKTKLVLFGLLGLILFLVALQSFNVDFSGVEETGNPVIKHAIVYNTLDEYWDACDANNLDIYHRADCEIKALAPPSAPSG